MRFENAFAVQAPIEEVWSTLLDVERVAPCMPGAEVLERVDENSYKVAIKVRVGPIAMTYRGDVADRRTRRRRAHGDDAREGARGARPGHRRRPRADGAGAGQDGGTHATLETDVALSGRVAAMGQGVIARRLRQARRDLRREPRRDAGARGRGRAAAVGDVAPRRAAGAAAAAAGPRRRVRSPRRRRRAPPRRQGTLPVGRIAAGVIAGRLANPRTLGIVAVCYAIVFAAIGFAIGRVV